MDLRQRVTMVRQQAQLRGAAWRHLRLGERDLRWLEQNIFPDALHDPSYVPQPGFDGEFLGIPFKIDLDEPSALVMAEGPDKIL